MEELILQLSDALIGGAVVAFIFGAKKIVELLNSFINSTKTKIDDELRDKIVAAIKEEFIVKKK